MEGRKTCLKRLLNSLARVQKQLNTRRYKKRAYVEQRLAALQQGQPAKALVDVKLEGQDGAMVLTFRINQQKLAAVRALDGRYALATNGDHLDANQALTLFKGQDGVEKRFGAAKGPLVVHPILLGRTSALKG